MRTLIVIALLALTGCAAQASRNHQASNTPVPVSGPSDSVSDRTGAQASSKKSGNPIVKSRVGTPDLLAVPGRQ